jgi:hypothetical protein
MKNCPNAAAREDYFVVLRNWFRGCAAGLWSPTTKLFSKRTKTS